jgi:hypothetical protein
MHVFNALQVLIGIRILSDALPVLWDSCTMWLLGNVLGQQPSIAPMELNGQQAAINVFIAAPIQYGIQFLVHANNVQVGLSIMQFHRCVFQVIRMVLLFLKIAHQMHLSGTAIHAYNAFCRAIGIMTQSDAKTVNQDFTMIQPLNSAHNVHLTMSLILINTNAFLQC